MRNRHVPFHVRFKPMTIPCVNGPLKLDDSSIKRCGTHDRAFSYLAHIAPEADTDTAPSGLATTFDKTAQSDNTKTTH